MTVPSWTYTAPIVASWARARKHGKRHFTAPAHAAALECHRLHALAARPRGWRTDGVYGVAVEYASPDGRRRDADRVKSLVLDALVSVAWDDDSDRYIARQFVVASSAPHGLAFEMAEPLEYGHTRVTVTRIGDAPTKVARKRKAVAA